MQKLALNLEDLDVQSFDTTPALRDLRCTVQAHQDVSHDELACSDACTLVLTCYSCETCLDPCAPPPTQTCDDSADLGRRIIVY
jgi:hypothetical protein